VAPGRAAHRPQGVERPGLAAFRRHRHWRHLSLTLLTTQGGADGRCCLMEHGAYAGRLQGILPWLDGGCMRYQVGAEELERVPSMAHRPDRRLRRTRTAQVGPAHAVASAADAAACGIPAHRLHLLDQDWEAALHVEKCPRCFSAVLAAG
jgi:hypothetical protein